MRNIQELEEVGEETLTSVTNSGIIVVDDKLSPLHLEFRLLPDVAECPVTLESL